MQISSLTSNIKFNNNHFYNTAHNRNSEQKNISNPTMNYAPAFAYKSFYLSNVSFKGDIEKPKDFSDTTAFASYLESRFEKDLCKKSPQDIEKMIDNIQKATGAKKKLIAQAMLRIGQFASYKQLPAIQQQFWKHDIWYFFTVSSTMNLNNIFNYLSDKKEQILPPKRNNLKLNLIADDFLLDNCDKPIARSKDSPIFIFDGWNTRIKGKDYSYTMFGASHSLEECTQKVIEEMQRTGKSLDEVLNGNIIDRIHDKFGKKQRIEIIKNENAQDASPKGISDILSPKYPDTRHIKSVIDAAISKNNILWSENLTEKEARDIIAKYFDSMLCVYSSESITKAMKKKYKEIQEIVTSLGKTMDDVYYIIPSNEKSFGLMTYHYAKTNNIKTNKIITPFNGDNDIPPELEDKVLVILDDMAGTGDSMIDEQFGYFNIIAKNQKKKFNIIFAPLSAQKEGEVNIKSTIADYSRRGQDFFCSNNIKDYKKFIAKLSKREQDFLKGRQDEWVLDEFGYDEGKACSAMPYMIPDNTRTLSNGLLTPILNNIDPRNNVLGTPLIEYINEELKKNKS